MSDEHIVTTRLEFSDRSIEGQVLHVGDKKSCARFADMIPAVAYSGDKTVVDSRLLIAPNVFGLQAGEFWRIDDARARSEQEDK